MLIGILQTGISPEPLRNTFGDYPDMFAGLLAGHGLSFKSYHVEAMEFPDTVHDCDGWLITGSRHGVYEDLPFIAPLEEFIRKAYGEHVPMVGICFGHQIIAQAMGGKVEKFARGWAVGPQDYDFGGRHLRMNAWHQDQVTRKPDQAEIIGSNAFCQNAALLYDDHALTIQAHPEFATDFIDGLMRTRGKGVVPDSVMSEARHHFGESISSSEVAEQIADFFNKSRN